MDESEVSSTRKKKVRSREVAVLARLQDDGGNTYKITQCTVYITASHILSSKTMVFGIISQGLVCVAED